jgi:hypothetical protein
MLTITTILTPLRRKHNMKKLLAKIANLLNPVYQVVYKTQEGTTAMYTISKPKHRNEFGNMKEGLPVAGFRAHCYNRNAVRSFRYDRIISMVRS